MTEKDNSHQHDESLVQQHALKRLDKVEEEKQKPYKIWHRIFIHTRKCIPERSLGQQ